MFLLRCGKVVFLHLSVILSMGEGSDAPRQTPPGQTPHSWQTPPPGRHTQGRHSSGLTLSYRHPSFPPPGRHPLHHGQMATAADGTHNTGMHSCIPNIITTVHWRLRHLDFFPNGQCNSSLHFIVSRIQYVYLQDHFVQ